MAKACKMVAEILEDQKAFVEARYYNKSDRNVWHQKNHVQGAEHPPFKDAGDTPPVYVRL